ncbi:MAG: ABC transporter ATP-binding protein [Bordetella sp. SCN 67-23]|nr:ABC transporter ATP-binding protein [Burkholderiales bacterium]ODS73095.1 MAG: ABC transporter ATP-binding protein [Bordetella sp. SCN 67-23]ODU73310.1 MAG: ABC transporter ATP-binding protein [Bordetella sp. SCN 68-11]OJW90907.1 MAG: ABC transporter ATP-binding protein [Burkholderiales bacterium 67-32]
MNAPAETAMLDVRRLDVLLDSDHGVVHAVDALDLAIARGQTFALVGESGCGKSMTALALLRLLPDAGRIERGRTLLEGVDLNRLPERDMRTVRGGKISIIFQEPATSLNPVMRVGDQIVETIATHTALRGAAARAKAVEWLRRVGIPEPERRVDDYPFQLSGGQKQRVMIAIALAAEPELLIADEPTTALDVTIQAQILELLRTLQAQLGMAMLLITHDLGIVRSMAHHVALMYAGQIVESAPADEFFRRPRHPYARLLFGALPSMGRRGEHLAAIPGTVPALNQAFGGCRFAQRCPAHAAECDAAPPPLVQETPGHAVRCVRLVQIDAARAAGKGEPLPEVHVVEPPEAAAVAPAPAFAASAPGSGLLSVTDLKVHFPIRKGVLRRTAGWVKAVDGVSLSLDTGKTLALVGESGCGKTTTGKALLRLLDGVATISGQASLQGQDLLRAGGRSLKRLRRDIQIIFQDPYASLNPRMRVGEILDEGLASLRPDLDAASRQAAMLRLLDQVGLRADARDRYPHEFSGGQRQRIAIARALAVEPKLMVCDEPTSALDVSVQAQILNLLHALQRDMGIAYLFITHNFGVVEYLADDIAVMQGGRIVETGPAERVLTRPDHAYTRQLLDAVPRFTVESA